jgi:hypothetical protein
MMFKEEPPRSRSLTAYDRSHAVTYIRLLDAQAAGALWPEVVRLVLKLDPAADPERLERMHRTHLERAEWMRDRGYLELAQGKPLAS